MSTEKPRQMKGFGGGRGGAAMMSPKQKIEKGTFKRLCSYITKKYKERRGKIL